MAGDICQDCGSGDVRAHLGEVALCDRCFDRRMSEHTGFPLLPGPPPPLTLTDAEGRQRTLRYRLWRAPTGIEVELEEAGVPPGDGYHRAVLGAHDADVDSLVGQLRERAQADLARRFLEPNRYRAGWVVADDAIEGRLVWSDQSPTGVGTPYDVIIDGRKLSWEEVGRALEGYEGWRLRLELADRVDDLRPDADLISFPSEGATETAADQAPSPKIADLLDRFLEDQRRRLAERTFANYASVVDLLRSCLNGYGYQHLGPADQERFNAAYEADEEAFVHLFGAREMVTVIPEFLGYFMVRKVMAGEELLRAAGTVTKKLAKWLADGGYLDAEAAADVVEQGADAGRDLPRAERLAGILYELACKADVDAESVGDDDYIDDYLMIERVEPGAVWFEGGLGPVKVPKKASDLARPGWSVNVVLARTERGWQLVEVGGVYP